MHNRNINKIKMHDNRKPQLVMCGIHKKDDEV